MLYFERQCNKLESEAWSGPLRPNVFCLILQVKLSPHLLDYSDTSADKNKEQSSKTQEIGITDVFKNSYTRKVTLIMFFNWIVVTLGNFVNDQFARQIIRQNP